MLTRSRKAPAPSPLRAFTCGCWPRGSAASSRRAVAMRTRFGLSIWLVVYSRRSRTRPCMAYRASAASSSAISSSSEVPRSPAARARRDSSTFGVISSASHRSSAASSRASSMARQPLKSCSSARVIFYRGKNGRYSHALRNTPVAAALQSRRGYRFSVSNPET